MLRNSFVDVLMYIEYEWYEDLGTGKSLKSTLATGKNEASGGLN